MRIYDFEGKKNISGERIREARLKLRLSQSDLAARVQVEGVTMERDSISRIEIGTRFIPDYARYPSLPASSACPPFGSSE